MITVQHRNVPVRIQRDSEGEIESSMTARDRRGGQTNREAAGWVNCDAARCANVIEFIRDVNLPTGIHREAGGETESRKIARNSGDWWVVAAATRRIDGDTAVADRTAECVQYVRVSGGVEHQADRFVEIRRHARNARRRRHVPVAP